MTLLDPPPPSAPASEQPGRRPRKPLSVVVWVLVALLGAVAWGVVALSRGEEVSAVWLLVAGTVCAIAGTAAIKAPSALASPHAV